MTIRVTSHIVNTVFAILRRLFRKRETIFCSKTFIFQMHYCVPFALSIEINLWAHTRLFTHKFVFFSGIFIRMSQCQWILIDSTKLFIALFSLSSFVITPRACVYLWYELRSFDRAQSHVCVDWKCNLPAKSPEKKINKPKERKNVNVCHRIVAETHEMCHWALINGLWLN